MNILNINIINCLPNIKINAILYLNINLDSYFELNILLHPFNVLNNRIKWRFAIVAKKEKIQLHSTKINVLIFLYFLKYNFVI